MDFPENHIAWVICLAENITVRTITAVEATRVVKFEQYYFLVYLKTPFLVLK